MADFVIGVDVGGTNTDTAILHQSSVIGFAKCPTTPDTTAGVFNSIQTALHSLPEHKLSQLQSTSSVRVAIGTTHFVNAVIQRDGRSLSKVAVIRLCGPSTQSLPPFVDFPEKLTQIISGGYHLVKGGMEYNASEITAIDEAEIRECVRDSLGRGVRDFVLCGVFSPCADPADNQETRTAAVLRDECQKQGIEPSYTLSHKLAMLGLLERENAAILNQSLKKLASFTIEALEQALSKLKLCSASFYLTQNDGTLISVNEARCFPVLTFSSGPTNSMRGATFLTGKLNAIVVDIGGTTTDVGVVINGFPQQSSTYCEIGGVKTNFPMPDVLSVGLGGGSLVTKDTTTGAVKVSSESVRYEITTKALCFGGTQCTATDIAIAGGLAPGVICRTPENVTDFESSFLSGAMAEINRKVEDAIDSMKTEAGSVEVILVGGGSIILDKQVPLRGVSTLQFPGEHIGVANAVGAALGTVGGDSDRIVDLGPIRADLMSADTSLNNKTADTLAREHALEQGRELAKQEAIKKGGLGESVYVHSEEVTDVTYVPNRVRVKVKAIASLAHGSVSTAHVTDPLPPSAPPPGIDTSSGANTGGAQYTPGPPPVVTDNPLWPFSSQLDIDQDQSAGLALPCVDKEAGVWTLSEHDVVCLATGAAILGCGGGGNPYTGQLRAIQLIRSGKSIKIINPFRVREEERGVFCGVAFMGAPAILIEKLPSGTETQLALRTLRRLLASGAEGVAVEERKYDIPDHKINFTATIAKNESLEKINLDNVPKERKVLGVYCLEVGGFNSIEPLLVGAQEDLPVLDADGMGRAFPELQMFVPFINGSRHTPSALADNKGEAVACVHVPTSKDLENLFRVETVRMGLSAAIASGVMGYEELMSKAVLLSMSQAWQLGRAVHRARSSHSNVVQAVVENQHGLVLLEGKVIKVQRETSQGFSTLEAVVEDSASRQLRVLAKNENYIAQQLVGGAPHKVLACTPDLITIVDSNSGEAVTTEMVRYGLRVGVVVIPANHMLKTPQAMKVVGPSAFGFDIPYQEPSLMD